jgi:hypothetical protein
MITTRIAGALGAGALAVGILVGSAGTIVLRDATAPRAGDWTSAMSQMGSMMSMMGGSFGMMNGQNWTGPAATGMPDWMRQHHQPATEEPAR